MNCIVTEINGSKAVLLSEKGDFLIVKNNNFHIGQSVKHTVFNPVYKSGLIAACIILTSVLGIFSYKAYYTPVAYLCLGDNKSITLEVNRFDRIINATASDASGTEILNDADVKNTKAHTYVDVIMNIAKEKGYITDKSRSVELKILDESEHIALSKISDKYNSTQPKPEPTFAAEKSHSTFTKAPHIIKPTSAPKASKKAVPVKSVTETKASFSPKTSENPLETERPLPSTPVPADAPEDTKPTTVPVETILPTPSHKPSFVKPTKEPDNKTINNQTGKTDKNDKPDTKPTETVPDKISDAPNRTPDKTNVTDSVPSGNTNTVNPENTTQNKPDKNTTSSDNKSPASVPDKPSTNNSSAPTNSGNSSDNSNIRPSRNENPTHNSGRDNHIGDTKRYDNTKNNSKP